MTDVKNTWRNASQNDGQNLAARLIAAACDYDDFLSDPARMITPAAFSGTLRDPGNPAAWEPPPTLYNDPWNMWPERLLAEGPDRFEIERSIPGLRLTPIIVTKTPEGYKGLPETGAKGPGTLGVGTIEEGGQRKPIPVSFAVDVIMVAKGPDGRLKIFTGERSPNGSKYAAPVPCTIGGFIDAGETPRQAAAREFIEEAVCASMKIDPDLEKAYLGRHERTQAQIAEITRAHGIPESTFKAPGIAEFKFAVLKHRQPEAILEISAFIENNGFASCYKGLNRADPRNTNDRAIGVEVFTRFLDMDELTGILAKHNLNLDATSDEIGKLALRDAGPDTLTGMYASHGPICMYAVASLLQSGAIEPTPQVHAQVEEVIQKVRDTIRPAPAISPSAPGVQAATLRR